MCSTNYMKYCFISQERSTNQKLTLDIRTSISSARSDRARPLSCRNRSPYKRGFSFCSRQLNLVWKQSCPLYIKNLWWWMILHSCVQRWGFCVVLVWVFNRLLPGATWPQSHFSDTLHRRVGSTMQSKLFTSTGGIARGFWHSRLLLYFGLLSEANLPFHHHLARVWGCCWARGRKPCLAMMPVGARTEIICWVTDRKTYVIICVLFQDKKKNATNRRIFSFSHFI